jgi:acyl dehydratase
MIDKSHIGLVSESHSVEVEKGRLKFFAKSIGETNPIYFDEAAARAAGYQSIPAPPTFLFSLDFEQENPFAVLEALEIQLGKVLHAEQSFTYFASVCAGDTVTIQSKVTDIYDKKSGALEFVVQEFTVTNQDNTLVAKMQRTIVVRN